MDRGSLSSSPTPVALGVLCRADGRADVEAMSLRPGWPPTLLTLARRPASCVLCTKGPFFRHCAPQPSSSFSNVPTHAHCALHTAHCTANLGHRGTRALEQPGGGVVGQLDPRAHLLADRPLAGTYIRPSTRLGGSRRDVLTSGPLVSRRRLRSLTTLSAVHRCPRWTTLASICGLLDRPSPATHDILSSPRAHAPDGVRARQVLALGPTNAPPTSSP